MKVCEKPKSLRAPPLPGSVSKVTLHLIQCVIVSASGIEAPSPSVKASFGSSWLLCPVCMRRIRTTKSDESIDVGTPLSEPSEVNTRWNQAHKILGSWSADPAWTLGWKHLGPIFAPRAQVASAPGRRGCGQSAEHPTGCGGGLAKRKNYTWFMSNWAHF